MSQPVSWPQTTAPLPCTLDIWGRIKREASDVPKKILKIPATYHSLFSDSPFFIFNYRKEMQFVIMEVIKIVFGQRTNLPRISLTKTHMLRKQIMVKVYFMTTQRFFFPNTERALLN